MFEWDPSLVTLASVKKKMKYFEVPPNELWRAGVLIELLSNQVEVTGFTKGEIDVMVSYICKS